MTMINTDAPGVTVEVTSTVNYGSGRPAQVRWQVWAEYADPDNPGACLVDLRFTPEQARQAAHAMDEAAAEAAFDNLPPI